MEARDTAAEGACFPHQRRAPGKLCLLRLETGGDAVSILRHLFLNPFTLLESATVFTCQGTVLLVG